MSRLGKFTFKPLTIVDEDVGTSFLESISGLNPLIAAGAGLLSLAVRLQKVANLYEHQALFDKLDAELKHFAVKAKELKYNNEIVLAAREVICVFLDEIISRFNVDKTFSFHSQGEQLSHERFFAILEQVHRDAQSNIDLLELIYFCLSLGLLGNELDAEDVALVNNVRNDLYDFICKQRGELSKSLLITSESKQAKPKRKIFGRPKLFVWPPPVWVTGAAIFIAVFCIYFLFNSKVAAQLATVIGGN